MSKEQCKLDIALAIEEFEEENVDKNLRLLIMDHYQYFRNEIQHAKKVKDTTKMKIAVHTLKSTSRYLCCEYFALKCQNIEDIIKNASEQIDKVYDEFIQCYEWFYEDAQDKYETRFKVKEKNETEEITKAGEKVEESKAFTVEILDHNDETIELASDSCTNTVELKNSNVSIPIFKLFKRNSTINEENEDDNEQFSERKATENRTPTLESKQSIFVFIRLMQIFSEKRIKCFC
jgi:hypothetical protein